MTLSDRERSRLTAVDRALSRDPVFRALCDLFVEPPPPPRPPAEPVARGRDRLLVAMVCCLVAVPVGVAVMLLGVRLAMVAFVAVGLAMMIGASIAFAIVTICRDADRAAHAGRSGGDGSLDEGGSQSFQARAEDS